MGMSIYPPRDGTRTDPRSTQGTVYPPRFEFGWGLGVEWTKLKFWKKRARRITVEEVDMVMWEYCFFPEHAWRL